MKCRTALSKAKPYKLSDGEGLYLEVMPTGAKYWRHKYRLHNRESRISYGSYPEVSLSEAREKRTETREQLRKGFNPVLVRLEKRQTAAIAQADTFEKIAREWIGKQVGHWSDRYLQSNTFRLEKYIFPVIGSYPISTIKPLVMLSCLQKIERTSPDITRRVKALCSNICKYAIATGRAENDPTYGLDAALKKYRRGHYASITVDEFPAFLGRLDEYRDRIYRQTYLALRLMILTFVRTTELIEAKKSEFDLENRMWVIPGERMKMGLPHMVPLSHQAVGIIKELFEMSPNREYLLPSYYKPRIPMCKNTMLAAIKRMGYNGRMTGHGFRSLALGLLKEKLGYSHEIADRQLAHVPKSSVDRAYDRAQFLPQRTEMMQRYSDYVDEVYSQEINKRYGKSIKALKAAPSFSVNSSAGLFADSNQINYQLTS
jgi:integrase